jgi:ankyrin repeat protein
MSCSSTIIERVLKDYGNKPRTAIAYFYFDFAESYKLGMKTYLSSLIAQICRQRRDIPVDVQSLYDRYMAHHLLPTTDDLLGALSAATEGLEVFLICDALDECAERDLLLNVLATISKGNCGRIKILATSRSERDIEIAVSPLLTGNVCIQDAKIDADIRLFVCNSIAKGPKMRRWPTSVKAEVESALVQGAKGMFRWVKCQLDVLRNCTTPQDLKKALKALPPTLDETYERILLSIDKNDRGKAHTALQWLTFSARPLQLQEVAEAVVVEPECDSFSPEDRMFEPYDIISICRSLVSISEDTSELRLAHYSVQEYLVSERIRKGPASFFSVIRVSADTLIAEVCLTYILLFDKPDSLSKTSLSEWPLLDYACKHWFHHAGRLTGESDRRNASRLTEKLFTPHKNLAFYQWLRVFEPDRPWISFDPHKEFSSLATPLYYSSYCCLLDATRNLLYRGANVDARGGHYSTPLNAAASRIAHPGSEAVIHLLIQSKADINMVDDRGWGPLHQTCWFGHAQLANLLLQSGADIDSQDWGGGSPMHLASFGGHLSVIQILLEHNAEIDAKARLKRVDLKVGSKYEARLSNRRTPLMEAAWNGQEEAVQMLLDLGANINAVDDHGMTTLIRAARCGHEKLVKILLSRGADAAVKDKKGWTAEKWLSAVCLNESGNSFGTGSYDDIRTDNEITIKSVFDLGPSSADVRSYVEHRNSIINSC